MRFIHASGWEDGVADLTEQLVHELADEKRILWLVSGGSNIPASVEVMDSILPSLSAQLSIMPVDERFGPEGHADSNWASLFKAGFNAKRATLLPVLQKNKTFQQSVQHYKQLVKQAFATHDVIVAQLGIGPDGHIAGILPNSPASRETAELVCGYQSEPYKRLTLTFPALMHITDAFVFAFGENKEQAIVNLRDKQLALTEQPAQILKDLDKVCIYNDHIGDA